MHAYLLWSVGHRKVSESLWRSRLAGEQGLGAVSQPLGVGCAAAQHALQRGGVPPHARGQRGMPLQLLDQHRLQQHAAAAGCVSCCHRRIKLRGVWHLRASLVVAALCSRVRPNRGMPHMLLSIAEIKLLLWPTCTKAVLQPCCVLSLQ